VILISESRGDSNRCTPCRGKSNQHTARFPPSVYVWPSTIRISRGPCIATFCESPTDLDGSNCSRETGIPDYIPNTPTDRSAGPHPVSLPLMVSEAIGLSQASVDDRLLGLLSPYNSMLSVCSILAHGGQPIGP
jgi:hypothetical protein